MFNNRFKIKDLKEKIILIIVFLIITSIPLIFWGNSYNLGGDDGRLYYLFPLEYFKNFTLNIISDNILGSLGSYFSQSYISGFALLIYIIKTITPFLNTQYLMLGLNLSFGFLFFYKLLGLWFKNKDNKYNFFIKVIGAIFYCFSTFTLGYTIWFSQLFAIYTISIFPLVLFLFLKAVYENKIKYTILASIFLSIFSIIILSIPWFFGIIICISPFLFIIFKNNKIVFIKNIIIFTLLIVLFNFHWAFHIINSSRNEDINTQSITKTINSQNFREENKSIITGVSSNNNLIYPFFNTFHKEIQKDYNWPYYEVFEKWNEKIFYINIIFLIIILSGLILSKKTNAYRNIHPFLLASFLLALFFFTVKIGNWGTPLFLFLNNNIPGFTMFRNMYDKFGLALVFSYSLLLSFSIKIIFDTIKFQSSKNENIFKYTTCSLLILTILLQSKPFISGEYFNNPIWTMKNIYPKITDFNSDFYSLTNYLKNQKNDGDRYLWLPVNMANYIVIEDNNNPNNYYSGVSPLQFLSNKQDFTSYMSFGSLSKTFLDKLFNEVGYENIFDFYKKMNINYLIVDNHKKPNEIINSYLFTLNKRGDLYEIQNNKKYKENLFGDKIKDFGRYSLYKINNKYENKKIYLSNDINKFPENYNQVEYSKLHNYQYSINIKNLKEKSNLVFLDPYHKLWEIYSKIDNKPIITGSHKLVYDYANGWEINPEYIKKNFDKSYYKENPDGSIDLELTLYFKPQSYFYFGLIISGTTLAGCITYLIIDGIKNKKKKDDVIELQTNSEDIKK